MGGDPGQVLADAVPELVVAAAGQDGAVAVPQQGVGGQDRAADCGMLGKAGGEVGADRLPADRAALFSEQQEAAFSVEAGGAGDQVDLGMRPSAMARL
ncbi:hypothetical protein [Dactylosporangium sp. NPDC006015]|uniref:hypothetical protein n=1 Tax=Dactylosporangium sp. NPDC006015 TaxID=3154576 RepID=UPI0033AD406C